MIANLMMYRRAELEQPHSNFWTLVRGHLHAAGIDAPETLSQDAEEFSVWKDPDLVLSQTCGMPYRLWLHDRVNLVGTPDYGLPKCPAGFYRSALIIRADDPRTELLEFKDSPFAYNQTFSQSGYAAPYWHAKPNGFWFENRLSTGAHLKSAQAVASSKADIAALDAVTWRNIEKYDRFADQLRVLDWTAATPALPLITAKANDPSTIFSAVENALANLTQDDRSKLGIKGLVSIPKATYLSIPNPP
jgi:ABC-type phosphate/phosphonate transport system substrate-binding protein